MKIEIKNMSIQESQAIKGKKIRLINGVVVGAIKETPDTWTLDIFVNEEDKNYIAGQFISISPHQFVEIKDMVAFLEYKKGKKEPIRAYSLASCPSDNHVSITVKPESYYPEHDEFPPLLSPILASDFLLGRKIEFTGYAGGYVIPTDAREKTDHIIHITAGSGVVPSYAIIKDELINNKSPHIKHTMILVNKTTDDIIFHHKLTALKNRFPNQFFIKHFITKEEVTHWGKDYSSRRPTLLDVQNLIADLDKTLFFACGPAITKWQKKQALKNNTHVAPRFMEWVHDCMEELKVDRKKYFKEVYG